VYARKITGVCCRTEREKERERERREREREFIDNQEVTEGERELHEEEFIRPRVRERESFIRNFP
jgi:hypothetical protein